MRWLIWLLVVLLVLLQYKLWVGDGSFAEVWDLYQQVETQREDNQQLRERNQRDWEPSKNVPGKNWVWSKRVKPSTRSSKNRPKQMNSSSAVP
jgi:hypothetical protein